MEIHPIELHRIERFWFRVFLGFVVPVLTAATAMFLLFSVLLIIDRLF